MKVYLSLDEPTGNFWIDNGLVELISRFGEGEHEVEEVRQGLLKELVRKTGKLGRYYDESAKQVKEYEKVNWAYPVNTFIRVSGKPAPKITIAGEEYPTAPPVFDLKLNPTGRGRCTFCGAEGPTEPSKQWIFPFLVTPDKFANFYPGLRGAARVCPRCALAGLAGYLGWLYRAQGGEVLHIFVFHSHDLRFLKELRDTVLQPLKLKYTDKGFNFPTAFAGPYIHETLLGLLLWLFAQLQRQDLGELSDAGKELLRSILGELPPIPSELKLYGISGQPGKRFNMGSFEEFSRFQELYRLYRDWLAALTTRWPQEDQVRLVNHIWDQFYQRRERGTETIWRERIARDLLGFGDFFPYVEQFLYEVRAKESPPRPLSKGSEEVFGIYAKGVLGMKEELNHKLKGFGHTLGRTAQKEGEMGLLYSLRNAKSLEEFYRVLNDIQFRLEMTIPEELLGLEGEKIMGLPWSMVKTHLSIYAMNAYLRAARPQEGRMKGEGEGGGSDG